MFDPRTYRIDSLFTSVSVEGTVANASTADTIGMQRIEVSHIRCVAAS
ncbi:hypothetical protein RE6C_02061 [Rhodopirellula europaea 6C]|uniref:Uncharacterized protein n=1 Tax=Rhodopirellula europaea 6C TaxID=1263867 RepID=M2B603_9BACT|nr:hypothetical protein RE6C_02061 [Rhodopirellula europaea 6C]